MLQDSIRYFNLNQTLPYSSYNYGYYNNGNYAPANNYKKAGYTPNITCGQNPIQSATTQNKESLTGKDVAKGLGIATLVAIGCDFLFCKGKHVKQLANGVGDLFKTNKGISVKTPSKPSTTTATTTIVAKPNIAEAVKPATTQPVKNTVVKTSKVTETAKPTVSETVVTKPQITEIANPTVTQPAKTPAVKATNPKVAEIAKPNVAEAVKPTTTQPVKNTVVKTSKVTETAKPTATNDVDKFSPLDTVSDTSAIPQHHAVNGYNHNIRFAVESRANNKKGLDKDDIEEVLHYEKMMSKLDKNFEKLPPLEHDCIVYKGCAENPILKSQNKPFEIVDNAKVGDTIIIDTAYTYTAFNRSIAEHWGGPKARLSGYGNESNRVMMFEIHLPKGAKVSRNLEHNGEALMPRGAQYKVIDKQTAANGDLEVVLEYILPKS